MARIQVLDESIANQIAAGEVVERPASVIKELVENSIDAGAKKIEVSVQEGGLDSIRIVDNGSGIEADDCETAFYRHATSKLSSSRDLFHIRSLGFRGEALPSIAAVSKVSLLTASNESGLGRQVVIEGGTFKSVADAPAPRGTDITVKELFYNTPARLKYMKTIQTELGHISDVIYGQALAHPEIAFVLRHNDNQLLQTQGNGDLLQVIAAIYGNNAARGMLSLSAEDPDYKISGYIGKPELARSNRAGISIMVNGRYIRSQPVQQAIMRAYHTLLPVGRFPLLVLEPQMHPTLVDVNVHPAKLEVRFSKEAELVQFVEQSVKAVLTQEALIPQVMQQKLSRTSAAVIQEQLKFPSPQPDHMDHKMRIETEAARKVGEGADDEDSAAPASHDPPSHGIVAEQVAPNNYRVEPASKKIMNPFGQQPVASFPAEDNRQQNLDWDMKQRKVPERTSPERVSSQRDYMPYNASLKGEQGKVQSAQVSVRVGKLYEATPEAPELPTFPELTYIGQHHGTYLIASNETGLYLIDQHAAHERINYEYYYEKFGSPADASQELLLPITLEFTPSESNKLLERLHLFEHAGVVLEHFGGQTFKVSSLPYWFPQGEEEASVREMAELVLQERTIDLATLREKTSALVACKASIKANEKLTEQEATTLLKRLATCRQPYTCPHGRPVIISFSTYDLEKLFKRVM